MSNEREPSDEIDLAPYVSGLWRLRYPIVIVTLLAGLVTFLVVRSVPRTYEAQLQMMVAPAAPAPGPYEQDAAFQPPLPAFTAASACRLVQDEALAAHVVSDLGLDRPPNPMTAAEFLAKHLAVEDAGDGVLVRAAVRMPDAALARRAADDVAGRAVAAARQSTEDELASWMAALKAQVDGLRASYDRAEDRLAAFKGDAVDRARLETERDLAKNVYLGTATRYERTRVDVATRAQPLRTIGKSAGPPRLIGPRTRRAVAQAVAIAFALSVFVALGAVVVTTSVLKKRPERPPAARV